MTRKQMPTPDAALKKLFSDNEVFASLFNDFLFGGQNVVKADQLEPADTAYTDSVQLTSKEKVEQINRYRDNIRRSNIGYLVILGIEDQDAIHYAMPIRKMLYDALTYTREVTANGKTQDSKAWTTDERLSKVSKGTKITPVITVIFYTGEEEWDGPTSLYDMMNISEELKPFVPDYPLFLIDLAHDPDLQFSNEILRDLKIALSSLYDESKWDSTEQVQASMMSLAAILAKDVKLYKTVKSEGVINMCEALAKRDERREREFAQEMRETLTKHDRELSEKDAIIAELQRQLAEAKANS